MDTFATTPSSASVEAGTSRLAQLENLLREAMTLFANVGGQTVETAWDIGDYLIESKKLLKHGEWLPWLERMGIDDSTAQRRMKLRRKYPEKTQLEEFDSVDASLMAITDDKTTNRPVRTGKWDWYTPPEWIAMAPVSGATHKILKKAAGKIGVPVA